MSDLIALEEHFALQDTLADSAPYAVSGGWSDLERRLLDLDEIRNGESVAALGEVARFVIATSSHQSVLFR